MRDIRDYKRGDQLSATDFNRLTEEVRRLGRTFFTGGNSSQSAGGVLLQNDRVDVGFWAMITGNDTESGSGSGSGGIASDKTKHSWKKVVPDEGGQFVDSPDGLAAEWTESPAYDVNGATVGSGVVVWLRRGYPGTSTGELCVEWLFDIGAASATESGSDSGSGSGSGSGGDNELVIHDCDPVTGETRLITIIFPPGTVVTTS